jgi:hypothetical protein
MTLNQMIFDRWEVIPHWVVYAGGTPGHEVDLPANAFEEAKQLLAGVYGPPREQEKWHPSHMRKPLKFGPDGGHVNLIVINKMLAKRRVLLTYWPEVGEKFLAEAMPAGED